VKEKKVLLTAMASPRSKEKTLRMKSFYNVSIKLLKMKSTKPQVRETLVNMQKMKLKACHPSIKQ